MSEIRDNRANLSLCWRMAEQAPSELERRAWLDMAESWRLLVITDDPWSAGELVDAHKRGSSFRNSVMDIAGMHRWVTVQWRRYLLKYRMIREKAASFVDLLAPDALINLMTGKLLGAKEEQHAGRSHRAFSSHKKNPKAQNALRPGLNLGIATRE